VFGVLVGRYRGCTAKLLAVFDEFDGGGCGNPSTVAVVEGGNGAGSYFGWYADFVASRLVMRHRSSNLCWSARASHPA
jgi:hypothetical protein